MLLGDLAKGLEVLEIRGELNIEISKVEYDSRKVDKGCLFVCVKGFNTDGHKYIESAIKNGAVAFLVEEDIYIEGYTFIKVKNSKIAMAKICSNFYDNPSSKLKLIGVTGTNGKTSITTFLRNILKLNNEKVGIIGTIKIAIDDEEIQANSTTPESRELQEYFYKMVESDCKYCAMEVSSHALALNRVDETNFNIGIFTNLTPDHLDFHTDLEDYRKAKELLFYKTDTANIVNIDDEGGKLIYNNVSKLKTPCYTYAIDNNADFMAKDIEITSKGVSYTLITPTFEDTIYVNTPGRFTVYNTLAIIASCYIMDIDFKIVKESLQSIKGVEGRFETIHGKDGVSVIIDYAHTPDALENILKTAKEFATSKIITVFGCGGDRDKTKRPLMGNIVQNYSDISIVTSDNPRTEEPQSIIDDILKGMDINDENLKVIVDRKEAIREAIKLSDENDVIIIAGKGHENYQIIGKTKYYFDDKEIATEFLREEYENEEYVGERAFSSN